MKLKMTTLLLMAATTVILTIGSPNKCDPENYLDPDRVEELQKPPRAKVSIHRIIKYRQGESTELEIPTYTKKKITVDTPWLTAHNIEGIRCLPHMGKPGYYDLELTLSDRGRREWIMLSNANQHEPLAFVIDGVFYRSFYPQMLRSDSDKVVVVSGPFDPATAKELAYQAEFNFLRLNDK